MEGHLQNSPREGYPIDSVEAKYISGLSAILVAMIEEAKDRISQIEYIFCSQLFPNFQSKSKSVQKIYSEARKAAEDAWKEKEKDLLLQIKKLQLEKQQALDENQSLKMEKTKQLEDHGENMNLLLVKLEGQKVKIDELERMLMQKSKEVDEGMELQNKLLRLVQAKTSEVVNKGKQLKDHEEKRNAILAEMRNLDKKVNELQEELREKTEEIIRKKEMTENLLKQIEVLISENENSEQLLNDQEKEKIKLTTKLKCLDENVGRLQEKLRKKTEEIEDGRTVQEQLLQKLDLNGSGMLRNKQNLEEHEKEKTLLLAKANCLEEQVNELQVKLKQRSSEAAEGSDRYENICQQIESKTSELVSEKNKRRELFEAYKRLKSQYNFLCIKFGLTTENMLPQNKLEDGRDSLRHNQNPVTSPVLESKNPDTLVAACGANKVKSNFNFNDNLEEEKIIKSIQVSSAHSPTSCFPIAPKRPSSTKSATVAGTKRPASSWRDTRSRQFQGGPDPHDDFLNTPLENVRENLSKALKEEAQDLRVVVPKDTNPNDSDDETQDVNANPSPEKPLFPVASTSKRTFKYVEPVRKKADRENLKGIECNQCKKFYDAVLPNNGGKDSDGNKQNIRCEHHDGVSRHRYKYIPPMTPEGFWNIGFESEM